MFLFHEQMHKSLSTMQLVSSEKQHDLQQVSCDFGSAHVGSVPAFFVAHADNQLHFFVAD